MSEATESSGTVKIVTFSGKTDTWDNWEFGFMCRAVLHGYDGILLGDVTAPTQVDFQAISVDTTDTAAKKTRKLYRYNSIAFSHLVSSMDASKEACHVPIGILKAARTTELPGGDAYKGFKALQDYYFNKSVASIQALVTQIHLDASPSQLQSTFTAKWSSRCNTVLLRTPAAFNAATCLALRPVRMTSLVLSRIRMM